MPFHVFWIPVHLLRLTLKQHYLLFSAPHKKYLLKIHGSFDKTAFLHSRLQIYLPYLILNVQLLFFPHHMYTCLYLMHYEKS